MWGLPKPGFACLICCAMLVACGKGETATDPRTATPLVTTALAVPARTGAGSLTGVVGAQIESSMGFRVGGQIARRLVDAGQIVRRGQPLMQLDAADLALGAAAQAGLVESAAARLDLARRDEQRMRPIAEAGFASRRQYDAVRAALDAARADHAAVVAQARVAGNNAAYAVLRADADGVIAAILAEPGQVVAAGQPVLRLARSGAREAIVSVPEGLRATLGSEATASIYGTAGQVPAKLRQLSAQADAATRTFEARYILAAAGQAAPLGATVTVTPTFGAQAGASTISVPAAALFDPGSGPGVWIVSGRDPAVHFRRVHPVSLDEEKVIVDAGLKAGERVVALGAHLLHEGDRVRVQK